MGRKRKSGKKKQRRNRRFWKKVTAERHEKILEIARRFTKDINDAYDLAQTVVLRLLTYCPKPIRVINLDAYIFTSTRNAWLDSKRRPQKEINFSDLEKSNLLEIPVLDPNLNRLLKTSPLDALESKDELNDSKLLLTKIWIGEGLKLPEIAEKLDEPVRRTRYRWYRYRNDLRGKGM
jgi:DNA-directed RNA polymerase specialized sigma24 family protein